MMRIDIKGLLEGIHNSIFVKDEVEKIAKERTSICKLCSHYSRNVAGANTIRKDGFCTDCGCNIYLKSRSLSSHCPLGDPNSSFPSEKSKWTFIVSDEEAEKLLLTEELSKEMNEYKIKLIHNNIEE